MEKQVAASIKQIEENMNHLAILNDEIRNPMTVIVAWAEMADEKVKNKILEQVGNIDTIINALDKGWLNSIKVWKFLKKYYKVGLDEDEDINDEESPDNPDEKSE